MKATEAKTRKRNEHHETVLCQCGCGQYFDAIYTTRKPKYADKSHKAKANKPTRIKKREARIKQLWRLRKQAAAEARNHVRELLVNMPDFFNGDKAFKAEYTRLTARRIERALREVGK